MYMYPDEYTFQEKFFSGLPTKMSDALIKHYGSVPAIHTAEEILEQARVYVMTMKTGSHYCTRNKQYASTPEEKSKPSGNIVYHTS